jgi:nucleotide-binding universal stress UspA family protein
MPFRRILFPTDFSPPAAEAGKIAAELSRLHQAPLTVMHVVQFPGIVLPDGAVFAGPEVVVEVMAKVDKALTAAKAELTAMGGFEVKARSEQGTPFVEIVRAARDGDFDLIIMGTHGRTGIKHALIGSVAEKVVRKAHAAVLTVRPPDQKFEKP